MSEHVLDLFVLNLHARRTAILLFRRGPHTVVDKLKIDAAVRKLNDFARKVDDAAQGGSRPTVEELRSVGDLLFKKIFFDRGRSLYDKLPGDSAVSIQIFANHPDILQVPWEYLAPPDKRPVPHRHRCVVRIHPACSGGEIRPREPGPLRVLMAVAEPPEEPGVGWGAIESKLKRIFSADTVGFATITIIQAATLDSVREAFGENDYDVFHFIGHGRVIDGESHLCFLDVKTNQRQDVSGVALANIFSGRELRLCVLSACYSSAGNPTADSFVNVASSLLESGLPAVVASQIAIPTDSVGPFVAELYFSLLRTGNIDTAVMDARVALNASLQSTVRRGDAVFEWGIPTLYRLPGSGQLFEVVQERKGTTVVR
ncbi:CHAT domain-containing protein [Paraburkholderia rhynchosiae]|nr:CHAT domain-containing protein [Paraburkholderia rhynchosiae]CAB3669119.1 hypothetical protein LMG27174_02056 [Paraburkholderia rhynchosiae]